jgi:hypothetical protein
VKLVKRWLRELTDKRLRRGSVASVPEVSAALNESLAGHNQTPRVFVWTALVERIVTKVATCKEMLGTLH